MTAAATFAWCFATVVVTNNRVRAGGQRDTPAHERPAGGGSTHPPAARAHDDATVLESGARLLGFFEASADAIFNVDFNYGVANGTRVRMHSLISPDTLPPHQAANLDTRLRTAAAGEVATLPTPPVWAAVQLTDGPAASWAATGAPTLVPGAAGIPIGTLPIAAKEDATSATLARGLAVVVPVHHAATLALACTCHKGAGHGRSATTAASPRRRRRAGPRCSCGRWGAASAPLPSWAARCRRRYRYAATSTP